MRPIPGILVVWLCAAVAACQGSPAAPEGPPVEAGVLPAGRYILSVSTGRLRDPSCTGPVEAWGPLGPSIGAAISLSARGDASVGRLERPSEGTLELELRQGSEASAQTITGTLRGTMKHFLDLVSAPRRTASFTGADASGSAALTATVLQSQFLTGTTSGGITFTHSSGAAVVCPKAALLLTPRERP